MIQTFAALLLAHAVADFLLQSRWMVDNKRRPGAMLAHGAVVFATSLAALGGDVIYGFPNNSPVVPRFAHSARAMAYQSTGTPDRRL